jgi:hypothetical protein
MALMPGAVQRPLPGKPKRAMTPTILCLHTMVGYLKSTDAYFRSVDVYSHFGVGGKWGSDVAAHLDGVIYQWSDSSLRAAANLNGNPYIISVETADNAARPIQPWTPAQEAAIVSIMVWAHRTHGIPLVLVPDSKPGRRGIAYHRLGCDPYRVAGGDKWSSAYGKDCPTQVRIARIPALIARANAIVNGTSGGDDVLNAEDKKWLTGEIERVTIRTALAVVTGQANTVVSAADVAGLADLSVRGQLGKATTLLMYGDDRGGDVADVKDTHPDNLQRLRGDLGRLTAQVASLGSRVDAGVDQGELASALTTALRDLSVDLDDDAVQRVAQATATLLTPAQPGPDDPAGV